ncbi:MULTISPECIES: hypothetical protein [unclassified Nitrobacter]|uniref:hypothetical protein n=1 Tax=unclassified Nitrobacter TaxID=2620411 RepID=UPI001AD2C772|nr:MULTISPECIES: hypothetical protein [unclassified Nitrobacter]MBN9147388.1 hypothetical protein [Nitrobacter sp.]
MLGDPAYYGRFGFRGDLAACFETAFAGVHFMVLPLTDGLPATEDGSITPRRSAI